MHQIYDVPNAHVCAGPVGRVVVGVAGAGGGARPHLHRGAEDAVRHQAGGYIYIFTYLYIFNIFILYVSILSTNHHQTAADHGTKPEQRQRQRLRQQQTQRPDMKPPAAPQQQQQQQQQLQPQQQQQAAEAEYPAEIVTTYPAHYVHFSEEGGGAGHYYGYQDPRLPFYGAEDPYYRHYGPPYPAPAQPPYPAQYEAVLPHPQQGEGDKGEVPYAHVRYANSDTVYTV